MRILVDINHPADVHQFRHVIKILKKRGHQIKVVARNKDVTYDLLHLHDIPFIPRKGYTGWKKLPGILAIDWMLLKEARRFRPDVLLGSSGDLYIAHVGKLIGKPSVIVDDTEHSKVQNMLCFPFADHILTPESYSLDLGEKQTRYKGFKEFGYCIPPYFRATDQIKKKLGVSNTGKYFLIRLVAWDAFHDIGKKKGFDVRKVIDKLEQHGKVFISSEAELPDDLKEYALPTGVHELLDVLHFARIVISEGGTTAAEAACMGTPVIYTNPLVPGYLDMLIRESGLITLGEDIDAEIDSFLDPIRTRVYYRKKAKRLVARYPDLNKFIADYLEGVA